MMEQANEAIHDVLIRPLEVRLPDAGSRITLVRFADHLLYRVGLVEMIKLQPGHLPQLVERSEADEVWALVAGACTFAWVDRREDSPTRGQRQLHSANAPTLVLAPFGVAFGVATDSEATLVRLATHDEAEDSGTAVLPWPEG